MDAFRIKGPCKLDGELEVPGAKNAALPLMAAALLTEEEVVLQDVPAYADVGNLIRLLRSLGAKVTHDDVDNPLGGTVRIQSITRPTPPRRTRSSRPCGPASACWAHCSRLEDVLRSLCPAAALSGLGRSTCTCTDCARWMPRLNWTVDRLKPPHPRMV